MSVLTDEQLDRYARHIVLRDIGGVGQKKILDGHILIVGAGGIGCPAIQYLAAAGIGAMTIIDDDVVSLSNLQRQVLFSDGDIGKAKVEVAKSAAQRINPDIDINAINQIIIILDEENHFEKEEKCQHFKECLFYVSFESHFWL